NRISSQTHFHTYKAEKLFSHLRALITWPPRACGDVETNTTGKDAFPPSLLQDLQGGLEIGFLAKHISTPTDRRNGFPSCGLRSHGRPSACGKVQTNTTAKDAFPP